MMSAVLATAALAVLASVSLVAAPLVHAQAASPAALAIGDTVPALTLDDQHGKPVALPGTAQWLLFAPDKAAADLAQGWLQPQGAGVLDRLQAIYVADISGMPAMVTRMFALPALREMPYPIGLVRDAALTAGLPRQPKALTLLRLQAGRITQVRHVTDEAGLRDVLGARP